MLLISREIAEVWLFPCSDTPTSVQKKILKHAGQELLQDQDQKWEPETQSKKLCELCSALLCSLSATVNPNPRVLCVY